MASTKDANKIDRKLETKNRSFYKVTKLADELGGDLYKRGKTLWFDAGHGLHDVQLSFDHDDTDGKMIPLGEWDSDANLAIATKRLTRIRDARARAGTSRQRAHAVLDMMAEPEQYGRMTANRGFHYRMTDTLDCAVAFVEWMAPKSLEVHLYGGPRWETDIQGTMSFADAIAKLRCMIDADCEAKP